MALQINLRGPAASGKTRAAKWLRDNLPSEFQHAVICDGEFQEAK